MILLDSVRPMGDQSLTSQGMGSARKILSQDRSYSSVVNAPWCINWNAEYASGRDTLTFPGTFVVDTFYTPKTPDPDKIGAGIDIIINHQKKFGLSFGNTETVNFTPILSGIDLVGIKINTQAAPVYRSNAYLPGQIQFPTQPIIQCRSIGTNSVELYLADSTFLIEMWNTGDTTATIKVAKNRPHEKYFVYGKTDPEMRGLLHSLPFRLSDGGCITTGIIQQQNEKFNLYPNPTNGMVQIEIAEQAILQIFNSIGILVSTQDLQKGLNQIDISQFPSGIYFLNGEGETKKYTGKIIKN
jgi:hypothetical protein